MHGALSAHRKIYVASFIFNQVRDMSVAKSTLPLVKRMLSVLPFPRFIYIDYTFNVAQFKRIVCWFAFSSKNDDSIIELLVFHFEHTKNLSFSTFERNPVASL